MTMQIDFTRFAKHDQRVMMDLTLAGQTKVVRQVYELRGLVACGIYTHMHDFFTYVGLVEHYDSIRNGMQARGMQRLFLAGGCYVATADLVCIAVQWGQDNMVGTGVGVEGERLFLAGRLLALVDESNEQRTHLTHRSLVNSMLLASDTARTEQ